MKQCNEEQEFLAKTISKYNRRMKKLSYGPGRGCGTVEEFERQRRQKRDKTVETKSEEIKQSKVPQSTSALTGSEEIEGNVTERIKE